MFFGERNVVGPGKCFTCVDLFQYIESLLKMALQQDKIYKKSSNYGWLRSRDLHQLQDPSIGNYLEGLRPLINKMSSERSAAIAVKIDRLTEEQDFDASSLLALIKKLLLEQDSNSLMLKSIKQMKEAKNRKRIHKVHPELVGRQATVSFIVESEIFTENTFL